MPVALGEPHLELIALAEDHQVRVAVGSRVAAGLRTEQDDAAHGGVRRELLDEPLDRLIHRAKVAPATTSADQYSVTTRHADGQSRTSRLTSTTSPSSRPSATRTGRF